MRFLLLSLLFSSFRASEALIPYPTEINVGFFSGTVQKRNAQVAQVLAVESLVEAGVVPNTVNFRLVSDFDSVQHL
jgi:hypothetical protein